MAEQSTNDEGPDKIIPADEYWTTNPEGAVKLRLKKYGTSFETYPVYSIPGKLQRIAQKYGECPALAGKKEDGKFHIINYKEYWEQVRIVAKAFLKLGLERFHGVSILGFNSPEWFISDIAAITAGGLATGIYTTNTIEACFHCLEVSRSNIIVLEDDMQLQKILEVRPRLPKLKAIIQYTGKPTEPGVLSWDELLEMGRKEPDDKLDAVLKTIAPNQCSTIVFTSGTMGPPKAAMISHDNILWNAMTIGERLHFKMACEINISYLPLSHIAAQTVDIYLFMYVAGVSYFADRNALKGTLINTLQEVQPTRFLGVPRVWEKIHEKMLSVAKQNGLFKTAIATWAKRQCLNYHLNKYRDPETKSWGYNVAKEVIFKKVKRALGLERCNSFASAAAPLSPEIRQYFLSIDIILQDCYGMSEVSGAHTICTPEFLGFNTVGRMMSGTKTKIDNEDENGHGEICMYGRHVFMGYMYDEGKTREILDDEGYLHSGDIGYVDEKGFVYITGRLKELLITAGGENVAPAPIENTLKSHLPCISHAFLVGDQRKFLSMLITLPVELLPDGTPKDVLLPDTQDWLESLGCPAKTIDEVIAAGPHKALLSAIQEAINKTNENAISNAQRIQKFTILPAEFSITSGELGPTMKVKRRIVLTNYKDIIDKLYDV